MPVAIEHDHGDVAHRGALALGDLRTRPGGARQREDVRDLGAAGELLHVDAGARVEHRAPLGQRDDRQGRGHPARRQPGALQRVDGDVDLGRAAVADPLAVVEHRRLVLLALADDHQAVHRDRVEEQAHSVDRRLIGLLLFSAPDPAGAASAAASVTRTSSSARFRSGLVPARTSCEMTLGASSALTRRTSDGALGLCAPVSGRPGSARIRWPRSRSRPQSASQ